MSRSKHETKRDDSHCGSWYSENKQELNNQLTAWIKKAPSTKSPSLNCVIVPHAGYSYSGSVAAFSYSLIDHTKHKTIFILGPSHTKYTQMCELSSFSSYKCLLGDLEVDKKIIEKLLSCKDCFVEMDKVTDIKEHSIEMQIPYISKIYESRLNEIKIVPILVGSLSETKSKKTAHELSEYFLDESNLFVISSDFCHWGGHFEYFIYGDQLPDINNFGKIEYKEYRDHDINHVIEINDFIESLDKTAMDIIESKNAKEFRKYLKTTHNTICGQYPILIMLDILDIFKNSKTTLRFVEYKRSGKVKRCNDSSVGYASGYSATN